MYSFTQQIIPSSLIGRAFTAVEDDKSWFNSLAYSLQYISTGYGRPIYILTSIIFIFTLIKNELKFHKLELIIVSPIIILYILNPPDIYMGRYLLPITSIATIYVMKFFVSNDYLILKKEWLKKFILPIFSIFSLISINIFTNLKSNALSLKRYDMSSNLLNDLAIKLNKISSEKDSILIYEVQSQYYLKAKCISIDGILGNEFHPFLKGEKNVEEIIDADNSIKYVVTMNSLNYRKLFDKTILLDLYKHDLNNEIGSQLITNNFTYTKIITNPYFDNPEFYYEAKAKNLNHGKTLRKLNNKASSSWKDSYPIWNSVYKINKN